MNEEINAVWDTPDERDYPYSEVCGIQTTFPEEYIIDDENDYQNQGLEEITKYMCCFYSSTHGVNIMNELEGLGEEDKKGKDTGLRALELGLLDVKKGANLSSGPKVIKYMGFIKGYTLVKTIDEVKDSLLNGRPVVVGSNKIKFGYPSVEQDSYGHAVLIIGWNKDGFIIKNSYGKEKYNKGLCLLPYNLFDNLFYSKYSLIDEENDILSYKKKIMSKINLQPAKVGFELGLWNGTNPTAPITREEANTMIVRGLEKLVNGEITKERIAELFKSIK